MSKKNIKDVAKLANVSIATVSYVINGKNNITEKTKAKVLCAIKETGYEPNAAARDLKLQNSKNIGLFLDVLSGPLFNNFISEINEISNSYNYNFIITPSLKSNKITPRFLKEKRIDGAVILSPSLSDDIILDTADKNIPVVTLDRELKHKNICNILIDNEEGIAIALKHLTELDHKKIGFIKGIEYHYDSQKRFEGFIKGLNIFNLPLLENFLFHGNFTIEAGVSAAQKIIKMNNRPTAIICSNDEMAIGLIKTLIQNNVRVPEDISVIGFNNIPHAKYFTPSLTTVSHSNDKYGSIAANILFSGIKGISISETIKIPTKLEIRDSTTIII